MTERSLIKESTSVLNALVFMFISSIHDERRRRLLLEEEVDDVTPVDDVFVNPDEVPVDDEEARVTGFRGDEEEDDDDNSGLITNQLDTSPEAISSRLLAPLADIDEEEEEDDEVDPRLTLSDRDTPRLFAYFFSIANAGD